LTALKRAQSLDAKDATYAYSMALVYRNTARLKEKVGDATGAKDDLHAAVDAARQAAVLHDLALYVNQAREAGSE
jgi:hypothetical protein